MIKIEWNKEENTISVGKCVFTSYQNFKSGANWVSYILASNGIHEQVYNTKQRNKEIGDILGCSRSVLYKHFEKLQTKAFIAPIYDVLKKVSPYQGGKRWDANVIRQVNKSKDILLQTYEDELYNILPLIALTGKSPKELKAKYKSAWKVVANNSLNKNKSLVTAASKFGKETRLTELCGLPTSILKNFRGHSASCMEYVANNFKGSWNKPLVGETRLFVDTQMLAEQLGLSVDPKWTPRRMKEEHDKMSQEITSKRYSKDKFECLNDNPVKIFEHECYVATLLDSAWLIAEEGNAMGHCVAGYSGSVAQGSYLVYSVTKGGARSSTVGIYRRAINISNKEYGQWNLQQQYGKYNAPVNLEPEQEIAQLIVKQLNGEKQ